MQHIAEFYLEHGKKIRVQFKLEDATIQFDPKNGEFTKQTFKEFLDHISELFF